MKRGYSRDFTPKDTYGRYLVDKIPMRLWLKVKAKSKREGMSIRAVILHALNTWAHQ